MNFSIEVPGEANPLSLQELCRVLHSASTSHDHSQRQSAGQQLQSWEAHQDYYISLQSVFLDRVLPHEIRLLAIIQLKNGIDKYWRHHMLKNAIRPEKREAIRARLFEGTVGEEDKQLALHNALVVAKIVRIDFPQAWPDAMTNLVALLRNLKDGNQAHLSGALLLLLRIVKEMGTARLRKSQTALQSVTPELVQLLGEIYTSSTRAWMSFLGTGRGDEDDADLAMENSLVAFKTLRRLIIIGYDLPHKNQTVQQAWSLSQTHFGEFLNLVSHDSPIPAPYLDVVGKHLMQFTKLHVEMAETHPASFASLPGMFDLVRSYWDLVAKFAEVFQKSSGLRAGSAATEGENKSKLEGPLLEKLALKGLLVVRCCLRMVNIPQQTFKYRSKELKEEQDQVLRHVKDELLIDELIVQMANAIISNLLVFRKADLDAWEEEPEEWEQQEETGGNAWEWEVRPCAENVLQHLLSHYKALLQQPLLSYFETVKSPQADVMTKEAVYTALGLAASHVHENVNFGELLKSTIAMDAQQQGPLANVLRRRIGILLSQWVPTGITNEIRPLIYEVYAHFLNPNDQANDIVVRITAARQFKAVADDFAFEGEMFRPYAQTVLTELIRLLGEVEIDETKLAILGTTKVIIERMETYVNSFAELIMSALPAIWASAGDLNFMLKQAVLTILQSLVMSMRAESRRYHSVILPLVGEAVKEGSDVSIYLIEEALELWENVLTQSEPPLSQELLNLAPPAIRLLEANTENASRCLRIVGSYILLAPETMLEEEFRRPFLKAISESFDSKSREHLAVATKYSEAYIRLAQELAGVDGLKIVLRDMVESGFLIRIFEGIRDAYVAHQTSGPNRIQAKINNLTLTDYFSILARIAVADPATFVEMLAPFGPLDQVWQWLSSEWFASFDCMSDDNRRKLGLLALTRLLELQQPMQDLVLSKLQDYFSLWASSLAQILGDEYPPVDQLVFTEDLEPTEWDTPRDVRERALINTDPVRHVCSFKFVNERLGGLVQRVGGEQVFQQSYLVNVDVDVVNGFKAIGRPPQ
ncbi:armadillo-type protein [Pseudomassariella vexata]|uniref:Armadillo-type protein n=1 Tax=Pseudomassariella vexata TaxID=1141098 RepID=A0A1Y2D8F6_9PEZI|nr:armadillo-type protein [Pseudomassariella vexata]ORY55454.1 armadillo-type protein [Pseudomassariella vexata]